MKDETLRKKMKTIIITARHIGFMESEVKDEYKIMSLEDSLDELIEEFVADCEREAAKLEITVDYYIAEFVV